MKVRFLPSESPKVVASFGMILDELPEGTMIGGGYIGHAKDGKTLVANLNPPFSRNSGLVVAQITAIDADGNERAVPSRKGEKSTKALAERIAKLWTGEYNEVGI